MSCHVVAPELVRPLPLKVKFRSGALGSTISLVTRSCFGTSLAYLGGLFHALGWLGPSPWRSSVDLGPRALHLPVVAESFADCLPGAGVALVSPAGD